MSASVFLSILSTNSTSEPKIKTDMGHVQLHRVQPDLMLCDHHTEFQISVRQSPILLNGPCRLVSFDEQHRIFSFGANLLISLDLSSTSGKNKFIP